MVEEPAIDRLLLSYTILYQLCTNSGYNGDIDMLGTLALTTAILSPLRDKLLRVSREKALGVHSELIIEERGVDGGAIRRQISLLH